jgi:membrane-bound metal-dependent hydrolase YbcI (DUF457 family)
VGQLAESAMIGAEMPSPIGHILGGIAAAWIADIVPGRRAWRTAPSSASWYAQAGDGLTLACAALAAAPDLDLLFRRHRAFTHSVTTAVIVGLAAGALAATRSRPVVRVALMCAAASATHVLLDWLAADAYAPFGIQALWPFTDAWYISNLNMFRQTERRLFLSVPVLRQNTIAVAQELAILGPVVWGIWLVRVKALAGLAAKLPGGDHPSK